MAQLEDVSIGYIKLYRCLLKKPVWKLSTPSQKVILITILLMVNHQENEWEWQGKKFYCRPGQKVTSLDGIVKACGKGISTQSVRGALLKFAKLEFLTNEATKTGRLITVLNWELYQEELCSTNKEDNKEAAKEQQRPNKDPTPNKNDKNDKNDKKRIVYPHLKFITMTDEENQKLIELFGEPGALDKAEALNLWKGSKGKKTASDYLTILNWDRRDKKQNQATIISNKSPIPIKSKQVDEFTAALGGRV